MLLNLFLFFPLTLFTFYTIGYFVIIKSKTKLEGQEILTLSFSLGIVIFVIFSFLLGITDLRNILPWSLILINAYIIYKHRLDIFKPWLVFLKYKLLILFILLSIFIQGFINFPSGMIYGEEMLFWSSQGHDGLWHVAVMEEIKKTLPPQNPVFAGETLYNYHYFIDVAMGEFGRIYPFYTSLDLYFRFFPILFSFLIVISVFSFITRWKNNKFIGYLGIFFVIFTGSFGYIVTFMKHGIILGGETVFWAAQPNTILGNPPHAIAFSLLSCFFLSLLIYFQERKNFWLIISLVIGGLLAGFKVSAGVVVLSGVGVVALLELIIMRKFSFLLFAIILSVSNYITFKLLTKQGEGHLMFLPWWFIRTMVVAGDRLDWLDLELRRQFYLSRNNLTGYLRVLEFEGIAFFIFLVGNIGMRVLGFYEVAKLLITKKRSILEDRINIVLLVTMVTSFLIPIFFVQQGIIYNNIQFMQYFILILSFYTAVASYNILKMMKYRYLKILVFLIIAVFSLPTVIGNLVEFYGPEKTALAKISSNQLEALQFLKNKTGGESIILTIPFNPYLKDKYDTQPKPIYAWYSTPYVSALASRRTFLTAEEQVLITGYPLKERKDAVEKFFKQEDLSWNKKFLNDSEIDYLYINKPEIEKPLTLGNDLQEIFQNNEVIIYKVIRI